VRRLIAACVAAFLAAGCGSAAAAATPKTVWLCKPGIKANPCATSLAATVVGPKGVLGVERPRRPKHPPVDCFYVYPTVSRQATTNANLDVDPEERFVAMAQASRFSQVCRVFAPMYPQITRQAILQPGGITPAAAITAYKGVADAFSDYLARYNHGRGIVFIGHSQGASMLIGLLRQEVDSDPAVRRRLVSALIIGGNVTVPVGKQVGGDFKHIPACRSRKQTGCVVAYSSFADAPGPSAHFGRLTGGLNPFRPAAPGVRTHVMCVNPASPHAGRGALLTYFPATGAAAARAPWVAYPREYNARCKSAGGATWLQVDRPSGGADTRPAVQQFQGPDWGLHVYDVSLALGNLVGMVRGEARQFGRASRR
jgi:DUF3089 family protein